MSEKNISCCQIPMNALRNKQTNKQSYFLVFMTACCSVTCFLSVNLLHYAFCGKLKVIRKPCAIHVYSSILTHLSYARDRLYFFLQLFIKKSLACFLTRDE